MNERVKLNPGGVLQKVTRPEQEENPRPGGGKKREKAMFQNVFLFPPKDAATAANFLPEDLWVEAGGDRGEKNGVIPARRPEEGAASAARNHCLRGQLAAEELINLLPHKKGEPHLFANKKNKSRRVHLLVLVVVGAALVVGAVMVVGAAVVVVGAVVVDAAMVVGAVVLLQNCPSLDPRPRAEASVQTWAENVCGHVSVNVVIEPLIEP